MENNLILVENSTPDNILNTQMTLGNINFDVEAVKEKIGQFLSQYDGLIIEKEDIKQIKSEIAFLRRQKELINKNRIKLSKEFDTPLVQYKSDCDSIIDLIEKSINGLNSQVTSFEEKAKEEKRKEIEEIMQHLLKLNSLEGEFEFEFDPRYLNTTYTINKVTEDLKRQIKDYYNFLNAQKMFEEKERMKKQLLETTVNLINSKNNFVKPMSFVEFEYLLDQVKYDELESTLYDIASKREKVQEKTPEIAKEETVYYNESTGDGGYGGNGAVKQMCIEIQNISEKDMDKVISFLEKLNVDYSYYEKESSMPILDLVG